MPVYDPRPALVKAAQNLVTARQGWEAALLEKQAAAAMVRQASDVGDPAEIVDAYQVLADYAASAVGPAEAEYQTVRLVFERLRDESADRSAG
jgi:hypothetical protein